MINLNFYEKEPVSLYLDNLCPLEDFESKKQHIQLFQHPWLGKVLVINGEIQHVENFQTLYHEMLVHLPGAFIPNIENVLILGGGSLFAAYEALKYPSVNRVVLCDYDSSVLNIMNKYYSHAPSVIQDRRFTHLEYDARTYILECTDTFDLIINDCFNLAMESEETDSSYFQILSELCSPRGACVDIIYRHIFDRPTTINTLKYLRSEKNLALSLVVIPEYPGILHLETIWGKSAFISQDLKQPVNEFQLTITDNEKNSVFNYYMPDNLAAYLYLPPYIKNMFSL